MTLIETLKVRINSLIRNCEHRCQQPWEHREYKYQCQVKVKALQEVLTVIEELEKKST